MIPPEDLKEAEDFLKQQEELREEKLAFIRRCEKATMQAAMHSLRAELEPAKQTPEEVQLQTECVDQVLATIRERGKVYGDPALSHHNIGLSWTGLIQQHYGIRLDHPLPAWLVELMMVAFKVHRSARVFHADNYVDAKAYLKFAEEDQEKGIV